MTSNIGPCSASALEQEQKEYLEECIDHALFEEVVNAPATLSEMTAVQLANAVLNHPMRWLILKNIVYNSITDGSLQKFEDTINEAVVNNYMVDEKETVCLDIKLKD